MTVTLIDTATREVVGTPVSYDLDEVCLRAEQEYVPEDGEERDEDLPIELCGVELGGGVVGSFLQPGGEFEFTIHPKVTPGQLVDAQPKVTQAIPVLKDDIDAEFATWQDKIKANRIKMAEEAAAAAEAEK